MFCLNGHFALIIGLGIGLVGIFNNIAVENISRFKLLMTTKLMLEHNAPLASTPVWERDFSSSEELITEFYREYRIVRKGLNGDLKKAMKDGKPIIIKTKIEKVTRRAQEQLQTVLEEQSRFALDIDLDAPKVRIPLRTRGSSKCQSHFLLDFGHFTLHTMESQSDEQRQNIYSCVYISGRDITAFFTDCGSDEQSSLKVSKTGIGKCLVLATVYTKTMIQGQR